MKIKNWAWIIPVLLAMMSAWIIARNFHIPKTRSNITFFHYWDDNFLPIQQAIQSVSDSYNQQKDKGFIHTTPLDHESFKIKIQQMGDTPPDLFSYWPGGRVNSLVKQNLLIPLDDVWENYNLDKVFTSPGVIRASTYDNHKYVVPVIQYLICFFYNTEIFNRYKLTPPSNWDEFLTVCETLKKKGITPIALGGKESWPIQWWFDYLLAATAGPEYRKQLLTTGSGFNSPETHYAFKLFKQLLDKGYIQKSPLAGDWKDSIMMMAEKKAAMTLMGQWAIGNLIQAGYAEEKDYDFFPFPVINPAISNVVIGGMDGLILTRDTKEGKNALGYFAEQSSQAQINKGSCGICPSSAVDENFYTPMRLRMKKIFDLSPDWQLAFDIYTSPEISAAGLNALYEIVAFPDQYPMILRKLDESLKKKITPQD